jgi:hypothetical protein
MVNRASQAITQASIFGNGNGTTDVNCHDLASQVNGERNGVNIIGVQK